MTTRKTLDYIILAGLLRRPLSGYDLSRWMENETSHYFSVGHSSIYPALARLEAAGLVDHQTVASAQGPKRKVYAPTQLGREELLAWAEAPAAAREVRDEQLVKVLCYGFLPRQRALEQLREEKARHEHKLAVYQGFERALEAQLERGEISGEAYLGTLLTLRRGIGTEQSYAAWCDEAVATLSPPIKHERS